MPYVVDSQDMGSVVFDHSFGRIALPSGSSKYQYGYRSGPLQQEEKDGIELASKTNRKGNQVKVIQAMDMEYGARLGRDTSRVHEREYRETMLKPGPTSTTATVWQKTRFGTWSLQKLERTGVLSVTPTTVWMPELISNDDVAAHGSAMMRASVPSAPEIDLARMVGEARDMPAIAKLSNYVPTRVSDVGGSILNFVFGIKPTVSDVHDVVKLVADSTPVVRSYVANERRQLRRNSTRVIQNRSGSGRILTSGNGSASLEDTRHNGGRFGSVAYWAIGEPGFGTRTSIDWSASYTETIRQFATWEYFIPRPAGFGSRIQSYSQKAERLLGQGVTPGLVYDLTPYSWLADWFVDFGGLLRYQEAVSGNNVVASRSGVIHEMKLVASARLTSEAFSETGVPERRDPFRLSRGSAVCSISYQHRSPGGPYSIVQPWDLTGSQASILAAIGISRGVPI